MVDDSQLSDSTRQQCNHDEYSAAVGIAYATLAGLVVWVGGFLVWYLTR